MFLVGGGTTANLSGALAVDPQGRYLYAADNTDQQISLFTLDPTSGLPTAGTGLPITVGATELTIDPAGAFLYMEDGSGGIHSYQIGAGGALAAVGTPPSSHPLFGRQALVVDPSGSFLLAVDAGSQNFLYEYSISAGALTPVAGSPFPIGGFGGDISELAFDPAASFLYAIDSSNDQLLGFAFSGSGLTPIAGSPFAVPASGVPKSINVDPSGKHVFVSYTLTGEVWTYSIASGGSSPGALTPVSKMRLHSSFELGQLLSTGTAAVTFTPKQLLVANEETPGATITQFTIDPATGNLSPLSTPIGAGDTAKTVATDPFGANAYAPAFTSDAVFGYTDIFGVGLSFYATEPYAAGNGPSWLTTDLSGSFLYVTMQTDNTVWKYDLPLQPASGAATISTHAGPVFVTTDPTGSFIYVADGTAATIDVFGIDSATGNLGPIAGGSVTQGLSQNWIAFDPSGRFAYSADPQFNAVWEFTIGTTGALTLNSTSHVSLGPVSSTPGASSVVVEPTGNFLYATNEVMGQIYAFSIDPSTGLLTQVPTSMSNGQAANTDPSPTGLAVDISGKFLYCVSAGATAQTASIDIFSIDLTTGLLTPVATVPNVAFAAGFTTTGLLQ
jgi:6-phosphogluconolactonase (cycloisomerase 2 family)